MTKVQARFRLARPLDEKLMARIADAHSIYGIARVQVDGEGGNLTVDFDASRLKRQEVEAALRSAGIPVFPAT